VDDVRDLREVVDEVAIGAERPGLMTSSPLLDPSEDDVDDLLEEDEEVLTGAERTGLTTSSPLSDPSVDDVLDLREVVDELVVGAERTGLTTSSPLSDPSADDVFDFVEVDEEVAAPEVGYCLSSELLLLFEDLDEVDDVVFVIFFPVKGDITPNSSFSILRLFVVVRIFKTLPFTGATSTSYSLIGFTTS
jgi:hypothetical protein